MKLQSEFKIGDVQVSPKRNLLIVEKAELSLEPRVMDVLCYLAQKAPEVVSRDELIDNIWEVEYGGDESLTRAISVLRKTFKSAGVEDAIIETIPKRGYRLVVKVDPVSSVQKSMEPAIKQAIKPSKPKVLAILGGVCLAMIAAGFFLTGGKEQTPNLNTKDPVRELADTAIRICNGKENVLSVDLNKGIECKVLVSKLNEEDREKYLVMAQSRDPSVYMEGLDQLERHANTFEDWRLIAGMTINKDPSRTIRATKRALQFEPNDIDVQTFRIQAYVSTGRKIEALEGIEALNKVAKTEYEVFAVAFTFLAISLELEDDELIEKAHAEIDNALNLMEANLPLELERDIDTDEKLAFHPYWNLGIGYRISAEAERVLGNLDTSLSLLEQSDKYFELLIPLVTGENVPLPHARLTGNNRGKAKALKAMGRYDEALKARQENVLHYFDMTDVVGIDFPNNWYEMGELYLLKEDLPDAKLMFENAEKEYKSLLDKNPKNSKALEGLEKSRTKLTEIAAQLESQTSD